MIYNTLASVPVCVCVCLPVCVPVCVYALCSLLSTRNSFPPRQLLSAISHVCDDADVVHRIIIRSLCALSLSFFFALIRTHCIRAVHALSVFALRSLFSARSLSLCAVCSLFSLAQLSVNASPRTSPTSPSTSSYYEYQRSPIESIASVSPPILLHSFSHSLSAIVDVVVVVLYLSNLFKYFLFTDSFVLRTPK